jgi:transposase InsO family protein
MLACVEHRFAALRAPHPVQWLADNGSAYTAHETLEFATALGLVPCFTPVHSPESNGISEAFVKTLKRDYACIQPRPDALSCNSCLFGSTITTKTIPTAACECAHPVSSFKAKLNQPRVRFNGGNSKPRALPRATEPIRRCRVYRADCIASLGSRHPRRGLFSSQPQSTRAVMTETSHRYQVGEHVEFHPSHFHARELAGAYSVERLLPSSGLGEVPIYEIKRLNDGNERVVGEDELAPVEPSAPP